MQFNNDTALMVADLQNDALSEKGVALALVSASGICEIALGDALARVSSTAILPGRFSQRSISLVARVINMQNKAMFARVG